MSWADVPLDDFASETSISEKSSNSVPLNSVQSHSFQSTSERSNSERSNPSKPRKEVDEDGFTTIHSRRKAPTLPSETKPVRLPLGRMTSLHTNHAPVEQIATRNRFALESESDDNASDVSDGSDENLNRLMERAVIDNDFKLLNELKKNGIEYEGTSDLYELACQHKSIEVIMWLHGYRYEVMQSGIKDMRSGDLTGSVFEDIKDMRSGHEVMQSGQLSGSVLKVMPSEIGVWRK